MSAALHLAQVPEADELLSRDPFALLVGMLLDQQVPMEKAFSGPRVIADRMQTPDLDPAAVAQMDPDAFIALMALPPAVHRYPRSMAGRVQSLARRVVDEHGGDVRAIWRDARSGAELLSRLGALPGYGPQKAKIFLALLGKQLQVRPEGWQAAAGDYAATGSYLSVADVTDEDSLRRVREHKQQLKAQARAAG